MKKIVFATNNAHKLAEVRALAGSDFQILSLEDIGCHDDIPETASTLEGNALIKARWVRERYGLDCFADDTGLMVDALDGEPGVYSARYAGNGHDSEANMSLLLENLKGHADRNAHFSTVIALCMGEEERIFEGRVDGQIAEVRSGSNGFGYDPIFIPDETGVSFADMKADDKNRISHRGRAVRKLFSFLNLK
ncbi:MAG: non-canonical purine NTP diphosphatase [Bacteroidales bacterium]|nr:non-canonical purine NTP diphosphatase [Bacteroidales bacterium]